MNFLYFIPLIMPLVPLKIQLLAELFVRKVSLYSRALLSPLNTLYIHQANFQERRNKVE
jgi:hypothetical protein